MGEPIRLDVSTDAPGEEERIRSLLDALPSGSIELSGYWIGTVVVKTRYYTAADGAMAWTVIVERADPHILMSRELYDNADPEHLRIDGDLIRFGTPGEGLGEVTYRVLKSDEHELLLERADA